MNTLHIIRYAGRALRREQLTRPRVISPMLVDRYAMPNVRAWFTSLSAEMSAERQCSNSRKRGKGSRLQARDGEPTKYTSVRDSDHLSTEIRARIRYERLCLHALAAIHDE